MLLNPLSLAIWKMMTPLSGKEDTKEEKKQGVQKEADNNILGTIDRPFFI